MAFAVYIPNDQSRANQDWKDASNGYLMSVGQLEAQLNNSFKFFSNLPDSIQTDIKNRDVEDIDNWLNGISRSEERV